MSDRFVKLYASILDSSIWFEPDHVLRVWLAMLAMSDPRGMVEASVAGLVRRANVSRELCQDAIERLMSPDPDSKTPDHEGRRIEVVKGGWFIFNYRSYWERGTSAERVKRHRAKTKGDSVTDVTHVTPLSSPFSSSLEIQEKEKVKVKRDVTDVTRGNATLEHGELVQRIRSFAQSNGHGAIISVAAVEALGADVVRAYKAVGGSQRFLAATGKDYSFLVREFGQALAAARQKACDG